MSYEIFQSQSRLRHLIWSHEDLESLVIKEIGIKLSDFLPTSRDMEIVKNKERKSNGLPTTGNPRELTDLAALPINNEIDIRCSLPTCELCGRGIHGF